LNLQGVTSTRPST